MTLGRASRSPLENDVTASQPVNDPPPLLPIPKHASVSKKCVVVSHCVSLSLWDEKKTQRGQTQSFIAANVSTLSCRLGLHDRDMKDRYVLSRISSYYPRTLLRHAQQVLTAELLRGLLTSSTVLCESRRKSGRRCDLVQ